MPFFSSSAERGSIFMLDDLLESGSGDLTEGSGSSPFFLGGGKASKEESFDDSTGWGDGAFACLTSSSTVMTFEFLD